MKSRLVLLVAMLASICAGVTVSADETTFCNFFITTLPYTITTQGHYCFNKNLSTSIASGAAITIGANFVVLDLNNFKLGGGAAGLATDTYGVYSLDRNNLTIRNGNIRGFAFGIMVDSTATTGSQNILVENNMVDGNTKVGISVAGGAVSIRNNTVSNTGGSTSSNTFCGGVSEAINNLNALCSFQSDGPLDVSNNTIINTFPVVNTVTAVHGIRIGGTEPSVISLNKMMKQTGGTNSGNGIQAVTGGPHVCRDNTLVGIADDAYLCDALVGTNSDN